MDQRKDRRRASYSQGKRQYRRNCENRRESELAKGISQIR